MPSLQIRHTFGATSRIRPPSGPDYNYCGTPCGLSDSRYWDETDCLRCLTVIRNLCLAAGEGRAATVGWTSDFEALFSRLSMDANVVTSLPTVVHWFEAKDNRSWCGEVYLKQQPPYIVFENLNCKLCLKVGIDRRFVRLPDLKKHQMELFAAPLSEEETAKMRRKFISLGRTPIMEDEKELRRMFERGDISQEKYEILMEENAFRYLNLLKAKFGEPPNGAKIEVEQSISLTSLINQKNVVISFDSEVTDACKWAFSVELKNPKRWE